MNISKKLKGLLAASVAAVGLTAFAAPMICRVACELT